MTNQESPLATLNQYIGTFVFDGTDIPLTYPFSSYQLQVYAANKEIDHSLLNFTTKLGFEWSVEERRAIFKKILYSHKRHISSLRNLIGMFIDYFFL